MKGRINMAEHPIQGMMDTTLARIREMVDASTVIGEPVVAGSTTVIPVSKISYGFASGGSDIAVRNVNKDCFGGGGGAGVTIAPVAFLVISEHGVNLMHVDSNITTADRVVSALPELFDKISDAISSGKSEKRKVRPVNVDKNN